MNLLADESVDGGIVEALRQEGHSVGYVAEMDPGISDDQVLAIANDHSTLLITADKDFGELVYRQRRVHHGIILLRLAGLKSETKAKIVLEALIQHQEKFQKSFCVISPEMIRIRPFVE